MKSAKDYGKIRLGKTDNLDELAEHGRRLHCMAVSIKIVEVAAYFGHGVRKRTRIS